MEKPQGIAIKTTHHNGYNFVANKRKLNEAILDSLSSQIAVLSIDGTIQIVNEAWRLFNQEFIDWELNLGDFIGVNYLEICRHNNGPYSKDGPEAINGIVSVLNGSLESFTLEYLFVTPGINKWFILNVTALPGIPGVVVSHTDITEPKTNEKKKDEFLRIASHELKTPITSLKGIAHILKLSFGEKMNREASKLLSTMDIQLNKLTKIIDDLLVVNAKPGRNFTLNTGEFNFQKLVKQTVKNVSNISPLHFLTIKESENISYTGDKFRLEQVITNLLTNAVKYSPQSNKVIISSVVKNNHILFSVQDFGIGLEKENSKKIFERFYRVDNEYKFAGLGLGLYIAFEIIKAHEGNLWVESQAGTGSTFYFSLPLKTG